PDPHTEQDLRTIQVPNLFPFSFLLGSYFPALHAGPELPRPDNYRDSGIQRDIFLTPAWRTDRLSPPTGRRGMVTAFLLTMGCASGTIRTPIQNQSPNPS
ncbi:hypothetical protein, partial [Cecembia lonarensis]|uniref:hypothetical protein n=1 Tax=Cecembia lonarensis TaxID=645110 RepID=UPI00058CC687